MATDYQENSRSGGMAWLYAPVILILFLGGALSVGAYFASDTPLTVAESIVAGYGGLAAIIAGLFVALFGVVLGFVGELVGIVAAGGAVAMTLFIIGSPLLAIVLIFMLMRRSKADCPDPAAHQ